MEEVCDLRVSLRRERKTDDVARLHVAMGDPFDVAGIAHDPLGQGEARRVSDLLAWRPYHHGVEAILNSDGERLFARKLARCVVPRPEEISARGARLERTAASRSTHEGPAAVLGRSSNSC
jgi:hypothetical protein